MSTYVTGRRSYNAICDVCGLQYKSFQLRKRWDGYMVCQDDWEPRHILDFYRSRPEPPPLPWTRPETGEAAVGESEGVIGLGTVGYAVVGLDIAS